MANCQNHMRYGQQSGMYSPRSTRNTYGSPCQNPQQNLRQNPQKNSSAHSECSMQKESTPRCPQSDCRKTPDYTEQPEKHCAMHLHDDCDCHCHHPNSPTDPLVEMSLAMAYVPWQKWKKIYNICDGFQRGTIFCELDKPFHGKGGCNR